MPLTFHFGNRGTAYRGTDKNGSPLSCGRDAHAPFCCCPQRSAGILPAGAGTAPPPYCPGAYRGTDKNGSPLSCGRDAHAPFCCCLQRSAGILPAGAGTAAAGPPSPFNLVRASTEWSHEALSLQSNAAQVLARDKPRRYSATCGGFPCKHLIAIFAKNNFLCTCIINANSLCNRVSYKT